MTAPLLSIIIPTHNRAVILKKCLHALELQAAPPETFEVIVVDDGSMDDTQAMLKDSRWNLNLKQLCIPHSGAAAARNRGATLADGYLLLFLGDDMLANTDVVRLHLSAHTKYPADHIGVIGHITWAKNILQTPFQKYLSEDESIWQFSLLGFDAEDMPFGRMYSSNLSVKHRFFIRNGGFDPAFSLPAYDDTELEYRFRRTGFRLIYEASAGAYHDHSYDLRSYCRRNHMVGRVAVQLSLKHPHLALSSGLVSMLVMQANADDLTNTIQRLQQEEEDLIGLPAGTDAFGRAYRNLCNEWFSVLLAATSVGASEAAAERGWKGLSVLRRLQVASTATKPQYGQPNASVTLGIEPKYQGISVTPIKKTDCEQTFIKGKSAHRLQATGPCKLCFNVDPTFLLERTGPLCLGVEYLDTGSCVWHVAYDSCDATVRLSPTAPGALKPTEPVIHGDSGRWKQAEFILTDWLFFGRCNGDFCIEITQSGNGGLYIHTIELRYAHSVSEHVVIVR